MINCNNWNNVIWNDIKILDDDLQLSAQNLELDRTFAFQQDNIPNVRINYLVYGYKTDRVFPMVFNEFWLESDWKAFSRTESLPFDIHQKTFRN